MTGVESLGEETATVLSKRAAGNDYVPGTDITDQLRTDLLAGRDVTIPAGHFYVSESIIVDEYQGTIKGAGKNATIIEAAQGFKATQDAFPLFTPDDRFTEILSVYRATGDVTMKAMTILVTGDAPAEVHSNLWHENVTTIDNVLFVGAVSLQAQSAVTVTMKDLRILGAASNDAGAVNGKNIIYPTIVTGFYIPGYSANIPINVTYKNCEIEHSGEAGLEYWLTNGGSGIIKDNDFGNTNSGLFLLAADYVEVKNNRFEDIATIPIVNAGGVLGHCFKDNTLDGAAMTVECPVM